MRSAVLLSLLHISSFAVSQTFQMSYGGDGSDDAFGVIQTSDNGYMLVGRTFSFSVITYQIYLVKVSSAGTEQWSRYFGNDYFGGDDNHAERVVQTSDGGYIVGGYTGVWPDYNIYFVKLSSGGSLQWERTYGGAGEDYITGMYLNADQTFVAAGHTTSYGLANANVYFVKVGTNANIIWSRVFSGTNVDNAFDVQGTADGGYIIAGWTQSFTSSSDVYLVKTGTDGAIQWTRTFGSTLAEYGYAVRQLADGSFIVGGSAWRTGGIYDMMLLKVSAAAAFQWANTYGGSTTEHGYSMQLTSGGGYIIGGPTNSYGNGGQAMVVCANSGGAMLWARVYGTSDSEEAQHILQAADGGFVIAGYAPDAFAGLDYYLVKTNSAGVSNCNEAQIFPTLTARSYGNSLGGSSATGASSISPTTSVTTPVTTSTIICNVLPLELLAFSGHHEDGVNILSWNLAGINDHAEFEVERRCGSSDFMNVGNVPASGKLVDGFTDPSPCSGVNYYRIKAVDPDEGFEYSPVIAVQAGNDLPPWADMQLLVSSGVLYLESAESLHIEMEVSILDLQGRVLEQAYFKPAPGRFQGRISLHSLHPGLYIAAIRSGEHIGLHKIAVME